MTNGNGRGIRELMHTVRFIRCRIGLQTDQISHFHQRCLLPLPGACTDWASKRNKRSFIGLVFGMVDFIVSFARIVRHAAEGNVGCCVIAVGCLMDKLPVDRN